MTEQVRARTTDLHQFFSNGADYRRNLNGLFSGIESRRSTVSSILGYAPETNWIDPFRELMAEATFNDNYVETIHHALVNYQPGSHPATRTGEALASIPASLVDEALEDAGYWTSGEDRSLTDDLLTVLDEDQLDDYAMLVESGIPSLQAEMLVSSNDPETDRFIDGIRLANLNQRILDWSGSDNHPQLDEMVRARNELIAELQGTEEHWRFDADIVALAAQNGIGYEEADFAVTTATIDILAAEVDGWTGHPNDPRYSEMQLALNEEIERLAEGDRELARRIAIEVNQGTPAAEALFDGVSAAYDGEIGTVLEMLDGRSGDPEVFDPLGYALQATLVENVEDFTGADIADVNIGIAAMAQENDLSYNSAIAMINMDIASEESEWPEGTEPFAYLDVPITSGEEAAFLMMADEEGLFRVIETANQGDVGRWDGKLSDSDWAAVLANPSDFSDQAVSIAQFFSDNPDEWLRFDTARDGMVLQDLADGQYGVGDGDGITSFADVQQYVTNQHLFTTLTNELARADSVLVDLDENGRLDEDEFDHALSMLEESHPNFEDLSQVIDFAMEADLLDLPDNRAWYEKIGSGLYTISSLLPGSPTHIYRMITEPGEMLGDQWSFVKGAGNGVVGIGLFAYDAASISPGAPGFWLEYWRTDGDMSEHRGVRLLQSIPQIGEAGLSLVPGTPQYDDAMEQVRRQGTWDAHPGLNLGLAVVDWEGFVENPAEWLGQFAPDALITVLSGGGGAISRVGSTGSRIAGATRRFVVGVSNGGLRFSTRAALRNGLTRASALGIRWQDGVTRFGRHIRTQDGSVLDIWQSRPVRGVLDDANFAQDNVIKGTKKFSPEGQAYFSEMAGQPITTVDDLVEALRTGAIRPDQVPIDYVIIDGQKLILNTRTSTALRRAGIPQSEWFGRHKTGITAFDDVPFDDLARRQLDNNGLPVEGSPRLGIDPEDMVRGMPGPDPLIAARQRLNGQLRRSPLFGRDTARVGVTDGDIDLMLARRKPLGFESEAQFQQFADELAEALDSAGLDDAEIGLKGTATTFYSENPGKPFGHHWDANPAEPADYDLNVTSQTMVDAFDAMGTELHPKYGIFRAQDMVDNFGPLDDFKQRWQAILDREVNFVGLPEGPNFRDPTEYIVVESGAVGG
ncbi:MAG: hypothetical protein ACR2QK_22985 [Acidimicrobiales bacterium]